MIIFSQRMFFFFFVLLSCNNNREQQTHSERTSEDADPPYPESESNLSDFLLKKKDYEIQYEVKGDLNNDGLSDIVIVLVHKEDRTAERPMLILLQRKDKTYYLDKVSTVAIPSEYTDDFKVYDTENVIIENALLKIELYGSGPNSSLFTHYKYSGDNLLLISVEVSHVGAGAWQSVFYDLEKGQFTEEITNTMEEDMPTVSKTHKFEKESHLFENTSPDDLILKAYEKIEMD